MPNWVINRVTVKGDKKTIQEFREDLTGESEFDFNKVIPEPKELLEHNSPLSSRQIIEYVATHPSLEDAPFDEDQLSKAKLALSFIRKYGSPDWYEWRTRNWGCKWNANGVELEESEQDSESDPECELKYEFATPWAWPEPVFAALLRKYTTLNFTWEFHEESQIVSLDEDGDDFLEIWHTAVSEDADPNELAENGQERSYFFLQVEQRELGA